MCMLRKNLRRVDGNSKISLVKVKDLLQLMIDATVDDDSGSCPSGKKLTSEQIAGFSVDFFLAGYETTATTLGFTSYLLAMHTDIQDKLQAEIDEYFEQNPVSLYNIVCL